MNFNSTFHSIEFLRPYWLLGVLLVTAYAFLHYQRNKNKSANVIASHLSEHLLTMPETTKSNRFMLNILGIITCIALSGPSIRSINIPVFEAERAQVIVFDLSLSMYATDIQPNRLTQAKYKAMDLLKSWPDGEKALIAFAGDAFTISPLTLDSNAIINHIPHLAPEIMPVMGSQPDLALEKAIKLLTNAGYQQGQIVFISDGFSPASEQKMRAMVKGTDWMVSVLAMATPEGAPIKLPDGGLYKNNAGHIVIPQLLEQTLYPVTRINNGLYLTFDAAGQDIDLLADHYQNINKRKESSNKQQQENQQAIDDGYWFAFLLLPLFLLLFRKGVFYAALLAISLPMTSSNLEASIWKNSQQNAYQAFQDEDYQAASESFDSQEWKAAALFKEKKYKQAEAAYQDQHQLKPDNANILYNLANAQAMQQKYELALKNVNQALSIQPDLAQANSTKQALEALLKQQEQQQSEQQNDSQEQQESEQQSEQQSDSQEQQSEQQSDSQEQQQSEQQSDSQEQQQSEQQSDSQEQQQSEQQSESQEQQQSEQQSESQEQQQSEQQSESQEQQESEQQSESQEQQQSEQQSESQAQQSEAEEISEEEQQAMKAAEQIEAMDQAENAEYEALPNWLKNMPDDPSLLLRNKMRLEYRKRAADKPVLQKQNGEIW